MKDTKTSWGDVANWYDGLVEDTEDSYQKNVILPNLIRLVDPRSGLIILDIACGQGYFSRAFAQNGARVIGADISSELIQLARKHSAMLPKGFGTVEFCVASGDKLSFQADESADVVTVILALQNIENISGTIAECARILKKGGRLIVVINHPAFRVLKGSSWQWDEQTGRQFRRIDVYMSDQTHSIDMTPGERDPAKKKSTVSFHRPLQSYFKAFHKAGLATTRLEEWISHRKSQKGPRVAEEDRMRKEIPLFVAIEAIKL